MWSLTVSVLETDPSVRFSICHPRHLILTRESRRQRNRMKPYWSTGASLTSLHCRCPLTPSISWSAQKMRAQLATNQAESRIVDHQGWREREGGGVKNKKHNNLNPGEMNLSQTEASSDLTRHLLMSPLIDRLQPSPPAIILSLSAPGLLHHTQRSATSSHFLAAVFAVKVSTLVWQ